MAEYQIGVTVDSETLSALLAVMAEVRLLNDCGQWDGNRDDMSFANAFVTRVREAFIDSVGGDGFERDAQGVYRVTNPTVRPKYREPDPELERLLDEEEIAERTQRLAYEFHAEAQGRPRWTVGWV